MHYSRSTPLDLDLDHVVNVIGIERFAANLDKPVTDWGLTVDECDRIRRGPHGARYVYLLDVAYFGTVTSDWTIECECGQQFAHRLLSGVMAKHDAHAGTAKVSHIHTADMLDS